MGSYGADLAEKLFCDRVFRLARGGPPRPSALAALGWVHSAQEERNHWKS